MTEIAEPTPDADHDNVRHRAQILLEALSRRGVCSATYEEVDENLRGRIAYLTMLAHNPPAEIMFQDTQSLKLLDEMQDLTVALDEKLEEIEAYLHENTGEKINVCQLAFDDEEIEHMRSILRAALHARHCALDIGLRPRKGRQPLHLYHEFVRCLHEVYVERLGRKGFSEKSGATAAGDFVDLIFEVQAMLPPSLQATDLKTVGSRILTAVSDFNLEK
jgi:hypothetical protein